jgi:hypothetical protein
MNSFDKPAEYGARTAPTSPLHIPLSFPLLPKTAFSTRKIQKFRALRGYEMGSKQPKACVKKRELLI